MSGLFSAWSPPQRLSLRRRGEARAMDSWIVRRRWIQATPAEGLWGWSLAVKSGSARVTVFEGMAHTRMGVRWQVWQKLRELGAEGAWRAWTAPNRAAPERKSDERP